MSGPDLNPLKVLLKELFEKVNFENQNSRWQKSMQQRVNFILHTFLLSADFLNFQNILSGIQSECQTI